MVFFELSLSYEYSLGLLFIFLVALIWSAASILVQVLYTSYSFDSPFLLTYIGVSLFTLLLPANYAIEQCKVACGRLQSKILGSQALRELEISHQYEHVPSVPTDASGPDDEEEGHGQDHEEEAGTSIQQPLKWSHLDHMRAAIKIAPVWFIANWTYSASLAYTSITSSTVLASTGAVFTFIFAVGCKDEQFTCRKFIGVLLGVVGSLVTALHDTNDNTSETETEDHDRHIMLARHLLAIPAMRDTGWWTQDRALFGDALGLISAVGYGAYAVMVRVVCPRDESLMSMELLLGYIGLFNMVILSPVVFYQLEQGMMADLTWVVLGFLVTKGLFDNVLSDYLWARAVVLTSATIATVGLGLTIPLAFISDLLWMGQPGDQVVTVSSIIGALSVLAGFVLVNIGDAAEEHGQHPNSDEDSTGGGSNQEPIQLTEIRHTGKKENKE